MMRTRTLCSILTMSLLALAACGPSDEGENNASSASDLNNRSTPTANNTTPENNKTPPEVVTPATLSLDAPENGAIVDAETQRVDVSWRDGALESLSYSVGDKAPVDVDGPFEGGAASFDVVVPPGVHRYVIVARFEGGEEERVELVLVREDVGEGVLLIDSPIDGDEVDEDVISLRGSIISEVAIDAVIVSRGEESWEAVIDSDGRVSAFHADLPLVLGENIFTITATDDAGEILAEDLAITRRQDETAPEILSALPIDAHDVRGTRAYLQIDAIDNVEVTSVNVTTSQNTSTTLAREGDRFVGWLALDPGWNTYTITARDGAGNEATEERSLYQGHRLSSGGAHGGAILDGVLHFWGRNNLGQIGVGYTSSMRDEESGPHPTTPLTVSAGLDDFVSISITQNTSIALDSSGSVWVWGDNGDGQLGLGTPTMDDAFDDVDRYTPEELIGLEQIVMISRGFDHTLALDASGDVWTWGKNADGQLGDGTTEDRDHPVKVQGLSDVVLILGASATSYAVRSDGTLWAFGENTYGNLGAGAADDLAHPVPAQVPGVANVMDLAAGRDHVIALTTTGEVYTWGLNASNQAGPGEDHILSPLVREDVQGAVAVYAGGNQSFIEDERGRLFGWGQNFSGNLGLIDDGDMVAPTEPVFGVEDTVSVAIGALQGLALRRDGRAFAWGWSFEGSLGGGEGVIDRWGYRVPILVALPEEAE